MKHVILLLIYFVFQFQVDAQVTHVFAGTEFVNFGIVDISLNTSKSWSSERSEHPGYFSLIENANYIGYSDQVNIDGYVKKIGNTTFVFPVGSGKDLRTLQISSPNAITDAYATAWIDGDPSNKLDPTPPYAGEHSVFAVDRIINTVSKAGQWDWQTGVDEGLGIGTTGNGVGLTVTVSMPDMTEFAPLSELRLVGWNGSAWIDLSGKPTATGNKENSLISGTMIQGITAIAIGKIATNLIVKTEPVFINRSVEIINPNSNTSLGIHNNKVHRIDSLQIYPNPITGNQNIKLKFSTFYAGEAYLMILNSVGQLVNKQSIQVVQGINLLSPQINNLFNGQYSIRLIASNGEEITPSKQFIKH